MNKSWCRILYQIDYYCFRETNGSYCKKRKLMDLKKKVWVKLCQNRQIIRKILRPQTSLQLVGWLVRRGGVRVLGHRIHPGQISKINKVRPSYKGTYDMCVSTIPLCIEAVKVLSWTIILFQQILLIQEFKRTVQSEGLINDNCS